MGCNITEEKLSEIIQCYNLHGETITLETYGLSPETFNRYKRKAKKIIDPKRAALDKLAAELTLEELQMMAKSSDALIERKETYSFTGDQIKIGLISDSHLGSHYARPNRLIAAIQYLHDKCDIFMHSGDVFEGMSHRSGHIYEVSHLGYAAQKKEGKRVLQHIEKDFFLISGNHDRWFKKSNGAEIVPDLCESFDNFHFMGDDQGVVTLETKKEGSVDIMLWHGEDGSSYAWSYRLQKIIESMQGGYKPHAIFAGHVHKAFWGFERNIQALSSGCTQDQTSWMRGKRIAAHTGVFLITVTIHKNQIVRFQPEFIPFFRIEAEKPIKKGKYAK